MATRSAMPARTRLRTAVRRKSCDCRVLKLLPRPSGPNITSELTPKLRARTDRHDGFEGSPSGRIRIEKREQSKFPPRRLCEQQVNGRAGGDGLVKSVPHVVRVGPLYLKNPQASTAAARAREDIDMSSAFPERRRDSCADGHWKLKRQSPERIEDRLMLRKRALSVRGPALHHCFQKVCFDYRLTIGETLNTEVANFLSSGRQILTDSSVAPCVPSGSPTTSGRDFTEAPCADTFLRPQSIWRILRER